MNPAEEEKTSAQSLVGASDHDYFFLNNHFLHLQHVLHHLF